jgi:hypothetical protein
MTIGTTSRTAHLLAFMKKGATYIRVPRGTAGDQSPARRPGPLSRLLSRSLAVCADHAACVTRAHPVRQEAQEGAQRNRAHQPRRLT